MPEIVECDEFGELSVGVESLLNAGELRLDDRITSRGYLAASIRGGRIVLRATKFVGTIPLTPDIWVRVRPRALISSLSYMLVRSGMIPVAISGFARGYIPSFVGATNVEKVYGRALVSGVQAIAKRGIAKEYMPSPRSTLWRGRLLASDTVKKHAAKGIRYRHEFDHKTLSAATLENMALKAAIRQVRDWYRTFDKKNPTLLDANAVLRQLMPVPDWNRQRAELVRALGKKLLVPSSNRSRYQEPLWAAFAVLQGALPDVSSDGIVRLDSLIVDVSIVFEAFVRRELEERLSASGHVVEDGNKAPSAFFRDSGRYSVHPDIVVRKDGKPLGLLDAKYKPRPTEQDRYELLAFMDAMGVSIGAFICPAYGVERTRLLGTTVSGRQMFCLRYDLRSVDSDHESERLARNVVSMLNGSGDFV